RRRPEAAAHRERAAAADLILDRPSVLAVRGVAGVDGDGQLAITRRRHRVAPGRRGSLRAAPWARGPQPVPDLAEAASFCWEFFKFPGVLWGLRDQPLAAGRRFR